VYLSALLFYFTISGYGGSASTQFLRLTHGEATAAAAAETRRK
jgi:hypothetical protein